MTAQVDDLVWANADWFDGDETTVKYAHVVGHGQLWQRVKEGKRRD